MGFQENAHGPGVKGWKMVRRILAATGACRMTNGRVNPSQRLEDQGISGLGHVYYNYIEPALVEAAVQRGEGHLGKGGAFLCSTGQFTGRSP